MKLQAVGPLEVIFSTSDGHLRLTAVSNRIIRLTQIAGSVFPDQKSLMLEPASAGGEFHVEDAGSHITVSTGELSCTCNVETGLLAWTDSDGTALLKEGGEGRCMSPVDVHVSVFDEDTVIRERKSIDGVAGDVEHGKTRVDRRAFEITLGFAFADGEAVYGFGSHEEGTLNYRGRKQYLYQQNMKAVVPAFVSTNGYGMLFDNYSVMEFDDTGPYAKLSMRYGSCVDYYFVLGPELDQVVGGFRELTGRAQLLPLWAFGYVQSKERYKSSDELIETVEQFRKRHIPLDCIVLDWRSWVGELWGDKNLDPDRFPEPSAMMDRIHALNARLMVSIWPHLRGESRNRNEMLAHGKLLGNGSTYNAFDEEARALYWKQAYDGLFSHGIDAWWCDCTEPFEADWRGEVKLSAEERMRINTAALETYLDPEYVNAFSLLHSKGIWDGQRSVSDKRVTNLTRSSFAGQQRYGTVTWSGDISAKWSTLRAQIADGLNFCASGQPYWTTDIGGFFVKQREQWFWDGDFPEGCADKGYQELYLRWLQFGAFLPMFRSHGTDTPREPWRFGDEGDNIYDAILGTIRLRYRMIPYIYSCAYHVYAHGYTMMRPMAFDFRNDKKTYDIDDQFMFGPALMPCPVTRPMLFGPGSTELTGVSQTREVYLPDGTLWYDFWSGKTFAGGHRIIVDAPLNRIPLFVPEGSILPLGARIESTQDVDYSYLELRIYPGEDARFTIYIDEGDGYAYQDGMYAEFDVIWYEGDRRVVISDTRGPYRGYAERMLIEVTIVGEGSGVGDERTTQPDVVIEYTGFEKSAQLA